MYAFSYYRINIAFESESNYTLIYTPHNAAMQVERDTARILVIVIMKTTSAEYESRTTTRDKAPLRLVCKLLVFT
jgi:cation transport regulator ChaC